MRKWHRWAAIPAGLILLFVSITGVLLHLDMIIAGQSPPGHEPPMRIAPRALPSNAKLAEMIGKIADVARRHPDQQVVMLTINLSGPRVTLSAGTGGPPGSPEITVDADTGQRIVVPPQPGYHYVLQDLHAGYVFGWTGRIISVLCGLALAVLAITGLQMWWDMRRRGKKGLYW